MNLTFGKHRGKSVERIVLEEPDYAVWMVHVEAATGPLQPAQAEACRLIRQFDEKPIVETCRREGLANQAIQCSVYRGSPWPEFWCEACKPPGPRGNLTFLNTYMAAVFYVQAFCNGRENDLSKLIGAMARAKGYPERGGDFPAMAFFGSRRGMFG